MNLVQILLVTLLGPWSYPITLTEEFVGEERENIWFRESPCQALCSYSLRTRLFTALEPIMDSLVLGCLVSLAVERLFAIPKLLFLSIHFGFWFLSDWLLFSSLLGVAPTQKNKPHSMPGFNFMAGWLFREITVLPIYLYTMCGNTVKWRDNGEVYRVCTDSTVVLAWETIIEI